MGRIRRLVLDTLKPHDPTVVEVAAQLADLDGIEAVNITIVEVDRKVENAKITLEGEDVSFDAVVELISDLGGAVHSIDQVVAGDRLLEETSTPQG